jgi:antitoxin component of RelBE/YafQ-DinJ toxin-antitoxin module
MATKKIHVRIREEDRRRLELIRDTLGLSLSAAFRAALVAMTRQMGFEKEFTPEMLKKK